MSGYSPFQDYTAIPIRASAVLTGSYVAGTVIGTDSLTTINEGRNQLVLLVNFTIGSLTSAEFIVEFSHDGSTFYQETCGLISGDTEIDTLLAHQITATGKYRIPVQTKDRFIRVSAKGTGTVTNSLMAISAIVGVA